MKVLGTNGQYTYFVELPASEFEQLQGSYGYHGQVNSSNIGKTIPVSDMYDAITSLKRAKDELPSIANKLRALADLLEPIQSEIPLEVKESDIAKEDW